jgi:hypothetical protein
MPYDDLIEKHFRRVGLDPLWGRQIMRVESGGNPNQVSPKTSNYRYKGLFQLDQKEFNAHGGSGSIFDPEQNTMAAANKIAREKLQFEQKTGRPAKLEDIYMIHQQGAAGYAAHLANPEKPAWQTVRQFYKSDQVAKDAITGNMTAAMKAKYGDNPTSSQFLEGWGSRISGQTVAPSGAMERSRKRREGIPSEVESRATEPTRKSGFPDEPATPPPEFQVRSMVPNIQLARFPQ